MLDRAVIFAFVGATCALSSGHLLAVEQDGLDFGVSTDKGSYTLGEPIRVTFTWKNLTDRRLVTVDWRGPKAGVSSRRDGAQLNYDFSVLYEGQDRLGYHGAFVDAIRTTGLTLEPGRTLAREYEITDVYSFNRPGRYVLRSTYFGFGSGDETPEHWRGKISHPDVSIQVHD